jgi:RNA polymerase sigma-70 factor, ECF subfamily
MAEDETQAELVAKVRSGDTNALAEYLTLRNRHLLAFIERQLGPALRRKLEPEDILQEVSIEAVRSLGSFDLSERDPFSWLCQLAERRIIDAHRRFFEAQKRDAGREASMGSPGGDSQHAAIVDMLAASMTTASQAFSRNLREVKLFEALQKLPEDQREALRLRYVEAMPSKEIAERLGKSDGAIRVMLTRSLGKLQELLGPDFQ